ncbi:DUF2284 domain-containing protein [Parasporobacterium paucivorans]|uniref:Predicted metal-binding protein n=1 Tax=Parasporobacterium paucivorans DSM 15970 TaxID=1122934 RepID=A0A1M6J3G3_9FIRM|nr:DUF2284 domain-containing protein [Parasporobacterium paucivorans]SHJ41091.1 Predicted metal-binding protein [Parasporobacterium paucivorans DSM 15970]
MKDAIDIALENGFSHAAELNVDTIELNPEVRKMCAANTCHHYGKNWSCPPACGTLDECGDRIKKYKKGIIVQSTAQLEDSFDVEGMEELTKQHIKNYRSTLAELKKKYPDVLYLGTGACDICAECTYPDEPCRFPDKAISSMEAYGMVVNEVCKANDLPYNYGKDTMTFVGCFLIG